MMGAGMDGIQYHHYQRADATCKRCGFKFYVRAEFERQWENQQQVTARTTPWIPIQVKIEKENVAKQYTTEYVPVKANSS